LNFTVEVKARKWRYAPTGEHFSDIRKPISVVRLSQASKFLPASGPIPSYAFAGPVHGRGLYPLFREFAGMNQVSRYIDQVIRLVGDFGTYHWVGIGALLIVVGVVCMRGFGSQKAY
jgi:hypothetical protein